MPKRGFVYLYRITNSVTGREYIGLTTGAYGTRWCTHRSQLMTGQHPSKKMVADMAMHGPGSFDVQEIERAPDLDTAMERERYWVSEALRRGVDLYNVRLPIKCDVCGRESMGKPSSTRCAPAIHGKRIRSRKAS